MAGSTPLWLLELASRDQLRLLVAEDDFGLKWLAMAESATNSNQNVQFFYERLEKKELQDLMQILEATNKLLAITVYKLHQ